MKDKKEIIYHFDTVLKKGEGVFEINNKDKTSVRLRISDETILELYEIVLSHFHKEDRLDPDYWEIDICE